MAAATTKSVRISAFAHSLFSKIAEQEKTTLKDQIDKMAEKERRKRMFADAKAVYNDMKSGDGEEWNQLRNEYEVWGQASADGLNEY